MTVMLHPNKINPERYRVYDRETKTQKYFPLNDKGLKEAEEYERTIVQRIKKAKALKRELAINKMFNPDGTIKGLSRKQRIYKHDRQLNGEFLSTYANLNHREIFIGKRTFDQAYKEATDWMMEQYGIESTLEIRRMIKAAKKFYWTPVQEQTTPHQPALRVDKHNIEQSLKEALSGAR